MTFGRARRPSLARSVGVAIGQLGRFSKSPFGVFSVVSLLSNLVAFVVSSGPPAGYIELDPSVQPGLLLSLARTEGILLIAALVISKSLRSAPERIALQGLVAGFLTADAVNDVVLLATGSTLLAMEFAWVTATTIPTIGALAMLRDWRRPSDVPADLPIRVGRAAPSRLHCMPLETSSSSPMLKQE